jgi:hypothetical protein
MLVVTGVGPTGVMIFDVKVAIEFTSGKLLSRTASIPVPVLETIQLLLVASYTNTKFPAPSRPLMAIGPPKWASNSKLLVGAFAQVESVEPG